VGAASSRDVICLDLLTATDIMLPKELKERLEAEIKSVEHPRELAVDVMFAVQEHYGYLSDAALAEAAALLGMTPLELDELATFYTFTFREPVGKYVIHVCDSVVCWMNGFASVRDYLCRRLAIGMGETTADGLFTLLPVCCIGYCDRSPAMLVNRKVHGELTPEKIDAILEKLRGEARSEAEPPRVQGVDGKTG
jgi:NADH-quinone oxidoreductase subunit E